MSAHCPAGHDSTELDYCSVCGTSMGAPVAGSAKSAGAGGAGGEKPGTCPMCSEPIADLGARFCEVCRYDFVAGSAGPAPRATAKAQPPNAPNAPVAPALTAEPAGSPAPATPAAAAAPGVAGSPAYSLVVQVDAALDTDPDPRTPCPEGVADVVVRVDRAEILVGRRDDLRDVHPDVPLADPGTSRRHAKFVRALDGSLALQDLASTNGSKLNGVDVRPGSRSPLHAGDVVTLGRWTRIRVSAAP